MATKVRPIIERGTNPYKDNVQGKANEPITVAGLLDRARQILGVPLDDVSLEEIYDRLEENAPRIAIIGGSPDHPAHILDLETTCMAAYRVWQQGGVPFHFSIPVECDGTAQSNIGMSYSLQSRNAVTEVVINQMEAHSYHGAFVIQGCDKTPTGILCALAHLDMIRQRRGDAPVFATFAPAHVLKGGTIPDNTRATLDRVALRAEDAGFGEIAGDIRDALGYILQCSSNTQFQGVLTRAVERGLLSHDEHKDLEKQLAVATCDSKGGVCAFNGTGNSSRHVVSGLGMVHPAVELLTDPPTQEQVNRAIDPLFAFCNDPTYSVGSIVAENFSNGCRIHSATGGSTNLVMHLVAVMMHAGYDVSLDTFDAIHRIAPVPDVFNYSLTEGRDIFRLAQMCCSGESRGMETVVHELLEENVPMDLDAPTVTGSTWRERMAAGDQSALSASKVETNPIILANPRRPFSGIDVLRGNFFDNAIVKVSGMPDWQLDEFDDKVSVVLYFESEDAANIGLLDEGIMEHVRDSARFSRGEMRAIAHANGYTVTDEDEALHDDDLFARLWHAYAIKVTIVISGQGPEAFGMPEMFTPIQHVNANRVLKRVATMFTDGRYSGVSYGAAIGHAVPEAAHGGEILYLQTGDLLHIRLRSYHVDRLDRAAFAASGTTTPATDNLPAARAGLGAERLQRIKARRRAIAAPNRMIGYTDAANGVVSPAVAEEASLPYIVR